MADGNSSPVVRRTAITTDTDLAIKHDEHISKVREDWLEKIGFQISDGLTSGTASWRRVAGNLGLSNDDVTAIGKLSNPGYETLKCWRQRNQSTLRALRQVLVHIGRDDVIKMLDECQRDYVSLTIVVQCDGDVIHELSGRCPSTTKIIDYVRSAIFRKMSLELVRTPKDRRVVIRMRRPDVTWSSPAKLFQAQQLTLEKIIVTEKRSERPRRRRTSAAEGNRMVFSETDVCVHFENVSDDEDDDDEEEDQNMARNGSPQPTNFPVEEEGEGSHHDVDSTASLENNAAAEDDGDDNDKEKKIELLI